MGVAREHTNPTNKKQVQSEFHIREGTPKKKYLSVIYEQSAGKHQSQKKRGGNREDG